MAGVCEIFRRTGDVNDYGWDPVSGTLTVVDVDGNVSRPHMALLYRGPVRVAPNQDWRARTRTSRADSGINHEARFQVPLRMCPPVHAHDIVRVIESPPDMELTHYIFHVRNVMGSTTSWIRNLLCDVDVAHPDVLPPPHDAPVVQAEDIPRPVADCGCG